MSRARFIEWLGLCLLLAGFTVMYIVGNAAPHSPAVLLPWLLGTAGGLAWIPVFLHNELPGRH